MFARALNSRRELKDFFTHVPRAPQSDETAGTDGVIRSNVLVAEELAVSGQRCGFASPLMILCLRPEGKCVCRQKIQGFLEKPCFRDLVTRLLRHLGLCDQFLHPPDFGRSIDRRRRPDEDHHRHEDCYRQPSGKGP